MRLSNYSSLMPLRKTLILLLAIIGMASCSSKTEKHIPRIHHVQIKNMKFEPAQIIVSKGDSIVWTNLDIVTHDVTEEKTKAWTSAPITMGKTWKMEAAKSTDYFCSIHIVMKGKIIVQ